MKMCVIFCLKARPPWGKRRMRARFCEDVLFLDAPLGGGRMDV